MDAALASLIAALIGGGIASGSTLWLERRRTVREQTATVARDRIEAVRAARLFIEELMYSRELLDNSVRRGELAWEPRDRQLPAAAWSEYRADFARVAPQEVWEAASDAYAQLDALNWHITDVVAEGHWTGDEPQHPMQARSLGPSSTDRFRAGIASVDRAVGLLRELTVQDESIARSGSSASAS